MKPRWNLPGISGPTELSILKQKILWLYENREAREAMGASALERVRSGYSWDDYGTRIAEAYACAVRSRSDSAADRPPQPALDG